MKKKVLSIVLTLCMLLSLAPMSAMAAGGAGAAAHTHNGVTFTAVSSEDELRTIARDGGSAYLGKDIELASTLEITAGEPVNLCLNGHVLKLTAESGPVIDVGYYSAALHLYDCGGTGMTRYGWWDKNGTEYDLRDDIYNISTEKPEDSENADYDTLAGGIITGGSSGVHNHSTFAMYGGAITGNRATGVGGGVYNNGTFTMSGGTIARNRADGDGGGVYNFNAGKFEMKGGRITGNRAIRWDGGGIYNFDNGVCKITSGIIDQNTAGVKGGGVRDINMMSSSGKIYLSGNPVILNNWSKGDSVGAGALENHIADNVALHDMPIDLSAPLDEDAIISISKSDPGCDKVHIADGADGTAAGHFFSDRAERIVALNGTKLELAAAEELTAGDSALTAGATYYLKNDVKLTDNLLVSSGVVTLNLNGHVLTGSGDGSVITVNSGAALNLLDSDSTPCTTTRYGQWKEESTGKEYSVSMDRPESGEYETLIGGVITGGKGTSISFDPEATFCYGGGVYNDGTVTVYGGTIAGSSADFGGGVCNNGNFKLLNGRIADNTAGSGGGVYNESSLMITSGIIDGNSAGSGGGVCSFAGTFTASGGTITGNTAQLDGGGVYSYGEFRLSGTPQICGNTGEYNHLPNNVYLGTGKMISLIGELTAGAKVGVISEDFPADIAVGSGYAIQPDDTDRVVSDDRTRAVKLAGNKLSICDAEAVIVGGRTYETLASALAAANRKHDDVTVKLLDDIDLTETLPIANAAGTAVTITSDKTDEIRTMKRGAEFKDEFFNVSSNGSLTLENITLDGNKIEAEAPLINVDDDGTLTLNAGAALQNNLSSTDGGVKNYGTLIMNGGTISGNKTNSFGGGVNNGYTGTFVMNGGVISHNHSVHAGGGGVSNSNSFTMNDGRIESNQTESTDWGGGGVFNSGTFRMSGGTITGNHAPEGGGVSNMSTFSMSGGSISDNTATVNGGGLVAAPNQIKATFSNNPVIAGNTKEGGTADNVYLYEGETIALADALTEGASIGISTEASPADGPVTVVTGENAGTYLSAFTSDNSTYSLDSGDGKIMLATRHTIAFEKNGKGESSPKSQTVIYGHKITEPALPAVPGYTMEGWYTKDGSSGDWGEKWDFAKDTVSKDRTLYARWTANSYAVKFDANGGTGKMEDESFTYDVAKALTAGNFTRSGYTFGGWNTEASGTGTAFADKAEAKNLAAGGTMTLYAQWKANTYTVKFDPNSGTGKMDDESFTYDADKTALTENTYTRIGYAFNGWNTKANGTGTAFADKAEVMNLATGGTVTLYAQWVPDTSAVKPAVSAGVPQVVDPTVKTGISEEERDAMQKATETLRTVGGARERDLIRAVSITRNAAGGFVIHTGAEVSPVIAREIVSKLIFDHSLTDASIAAEPFLRLQVTGAKVMEDTIAEITYNIHPLVNVRLQGTGFAQVLSSYGIENITKPVTITLTLPKGFAVPEGYKIQVVHTRDDGTQYTYDVERDGSMITFVNPHGFSEFTVQTVPFAAKTGDTSHTGLWIGIAVAAAVGAAAIIIVYHHKKKKDQ